MKCIFVPVALLIFIYEFLDVVENGFDSAHLYYWGPAGFIGVIYIFAIIHKWKEKDKEEL